MQKTKKSFSKRFKITGSGKVLRRKPGHRHLLSCKSPKRKRSACKDLVVPTGMAKLVKKCMPFA